MISRICRSSFYVGILGRTSSAVRWTRPSLHTFQKPSVDDACPEANLSFLVFCPRRSVTLFETDHRSRCAVHRCLASNLASSAGDS